MSAGRDGVAGTARWLGPLSPALLVLLAFFAGPVLWCAYAAFTNASLTGSGAKDTRFVGLENFAELFGDSAVVNSTVLTVLFVAGSALIGQNALGLGLALLMRGREPVVRAVVGLAVVAAWVVPEIVAAFIWLAFLDPEGTLNTWLTSIGLPGQEWLYANPMIAVILANVWRGTAFSMLVYSAALTEVPTDVEESSELDGAFGWRKLAYVTLPIIRRSIFTTFLLITLQTLQVFTLVFVMTGGGPGTKSQTLPLLMYEQAFQYSELGYGSAIALVLLAVGAAFSLVYLRTLRAEEH